MKYRLMFHLGEFLIFASLLLVACDRQKTVCPLPTGTLQPKPVLAELIALPPPEPSSKPITVEINGKMMTIDKLVDYPLCNDTWSGTVYVGCDAVVAEADIDAEENPRFLEGCNLEIAENTVVYVAAHNDAAYYKGCSCHTGGDPLP